MKSILILSAVLLTGCSSLNVSWVATVSYNADAKTEATVKHVQVPNPAGR